MTHSYYSCYPYTDPLDGSELAYAIERTKRVFIDAILRISREAVD